MSFIPKQDKTPKARVTVHLRQDTADMANQYAAYLDSDLDHVIEQLLLKAFRSDKEFQTTHVVHLNSAAKNGRKKSEIACQI